MKEIDKNSDQDLFEEFEFKPLTEGLGFHKKAEQIKTSIQSSRIGEAHSGRMIPERPIATEPTLTSATPASDSISRLMATLPPLGAPDLDFVEQGATPISSKTKQVAAELSAATQAPLATATAAPRSQHGFRQSEFQARLEESFAKAFPQRAAAKQATKDLGISRQSKTVEPATELQMTPVAASISGAVVDALTVIGISILCLVIILGITQADLFGLLNNAQTDRITQFHLAVLFLSTLQLYMLTARSFFGMSLGEWAFDTQLGTSREQAKPLYPLQVVWRTLLSTATLFALPLISFIARRDLLRPLTGLQLYRRNDQENL